MNHDAVDHTPLSDRAYLLPPCISGLSDEFLSEALSRIILLGSSKK